MRLTSVETTPNPNSMKLNFDEPVGKSVTYTRDSREGCPETLGLLLDIEGVNSLFVCHDFATLNRDPRADWRPILDIVTRILSGGETEVEAGTHASGVGMTGISAEVKVPPTETIVPAPTNLMAGAPRESAEKHGQVQVLVQTFRGVPIQVKVSSVDSENRVALSSRFNEAAQFIQQQTSADYLKERYWADWGTRYGSPEQVANEVAEEIEGTVDIKALERLVAAAIGKVAEPVLSATPESLRADFQSDDWHLRLRAVQTIGTTDDAIPLLAEALKDTNPQVRRLAAAALGATGSVEAVPFLCEAFMNDSHVGVRRTAGDGLSDIGDPSAELAACRALTDSNKLVRWRAARFLFGVGTKEALPMLEQAQNDSEFEVHLEIEAAIERIKGGGGSSVPAWKKIVQDA